MGAARAVTAALKKNKIVNFMMAKVGEGEKER